MLPRLIPDASLNPEFTQILLFTRTRKSVICRDIQELTLRFP
jgi:hypothetical protein